MTDRQLAEKMAEALEGLRSAYMSFHLARIDYESEQCAETTSLVSEASCAVADAEKNAESALADYRARNEGWIDIESETPCVGEEVIVRLETCAHTVGDEKTRGAIFMIHGARKVTHWRRPLTKGEA